jgi:hypothetical protein
MLFKRILLLLLVSLTLLGSCRTRRASRGNWVNGPKAWSAEVGQVKNEEWVKREVEYIDALRSRR